MRNQTDNDLLGRYLAARTLMSIIITRGEIVGIPAQKGKDSTDQIGSFNCFVSATDSDGMNIRCQLTMKMKSSVITA